MIMVKGKYERKRSVILNLDTGEYDQCFSWRNTPSINAAKRASRKLQEARGGLGCGLVRVWRPDE